ncbi:MAG: 7-carboxy-7-deazaguanine synthase QueE [Muribaculaceae bacterium]
MWKIHKIFYSLIGEGFFTGTPAVFISFAGCNLHCSFCDAADLDGSNMSLYQIVNEIKKYPNAHHIVLTGGEPAIFIDQDFVDALKRTGKFIIIETNGTKNLPKGIDWVTFSPKHSFAGGDAAPLLLKECNELRVVYLGQDISQYAAIKAEHRYLQPCYCEEEEMRKYILRSCINAVLANPDWTLSLQIQRIIGII